MSVIILGDKSCLVTNKDGYEVYNDFVCVKNISAIGDRIICNNRDFFINYEEIPSVSLLYKNKFIKNYKELKQSQLKFFDAKLSDYKLSNKLSLLNSLALIEKSNTNKLIDTYQNIGIIEHFAFVVSSVLDLKGHWFVISENVLGGYNIVIGYNEIVMLYRMIDNTDAVSAEITKSENYLLKFGLTADNIKHRIAFIKFLELKNSFLSKCKVYNEYGDVYIAKKVNEYHTSNPFLIINHKGYFKMKIGQIFRKILICCVPLFLVLIVISIYCNYEKKSENVCIKNKSNVIEDSIAKLEHKIKRLTTKPSRNVDNFMRHEFEDFDNLYSGLKESYKKLSKELEDLENSINNSKMSMFSNKDEFHDSINLKLILPENVNLISYHYEFSSVNKENKARLLMKISANDERDLDRLIINMNKYDKNFHVEKIERISRDIYMVAFIK